jgi:hypothetical protein
MLETVPCDWVHREGGKMSIDRLIVGTFVQYGNQPLQKRLKGHFGFQFLDGDLSFIRTHE